MKQPVVFFFKPIGLLCAGLAIAEAIWFLSPHPVSKIGRWPIYKEDIQKRAEVERLYGAREAIEETALKKLEASARHLQILEKHGLTVTRDDLAEEDKRIDASTRSPLLLKKIKEIFGGDHDAYLKNYVKPTLVDRIIAFEFFPRTPSLQEKSKKIAIDLIAHVESGKESLRSLAETRALVTHTISLGGRQKPRVLSKERSRDLRMLGPIERMKDVWQPNWVRKFSKRLKPGEILGSPLDERTAWMVIQRLETSHQNKEEYLVVIVPKLRYTEWLASELKSLE